MRKMLFVGGVLAVLLAAGIGMAASTASAHEGREVGDYRLVVGWWEEPTYEGHRNAVLVRVTRLGSDEGDHDAEDSNAEDGHHHDSEDEDEDDHATKLSVAGGKMASPAPRPYGSPEVPVEGLQGSLLVEITHVSSESSRVLNVRAMPDEPGSYVADLIPTAAGVYQVRVFGAIEGTRIDETFVSEGGGGDFDDVQSSTALQFPVKLPETRELESAVRGAMQTAQQAQDAALATEVESGTDVLVIVALALAGVGSVTGLLGLYLALRRR